jgi:hypothetical protein
MGAEFVVAYLVWELFTFQMEEEGYSADVVFGGIWMRHLFSYSQLHLARAALRCQHTL